MKQLIWYLPLILTLVLSLPVLAANTGNVDAQNGQWGAKVSGAPLSHALAGKGLMFGNIKADFIPPVGWQGTATVTDPGRLVVAGPQLKGVKKGETIQIKKIGPDKYKLMSTASGKSSVITVK